MTIKVNGTNDPAVGIPEWLPCFVCRKPLSAHIELKCPFEASTFCPSDAKIILSALYEMRRMQSRRCSDYKNEPDQEEDYRVALEIVMDRWLKTQGVD